MTASCFLGPELWCKSRANAGLLVAVARHLWGPTCTGRLGSGRKKKRKKKKRAAKGGSATARSNQDRTGGSAGGRAGCPIIEWSRWAVECEARVRAQEPLWRWEAAESQQR